MDEFHFYSEPDRGWAWQVPLLELPQAQFVLMSATLGDVEPVRRRPDAPYRPGDRGRQRPPTGRCRCPTSWALTPLHETLEELLTTHQAPVYVVHFTQASALERAQALTSINVCTREEKDRIAELIGGFRFSPGFGKTAVPPGPARHRRAPRRDAAEVPPAGRAARPGRAAEGHLRHRHPRRRDQRADPHGRVHRADQVRRHAASGCSRRASSTRSPGAPAGPASTPPGTVVVQAPEHVVENHRLLAKAGDDPKKLGARCSARSRPRAQVTWTEETFDRLVAAEPEALVSRMRVSHSMLLNVIARARRPVRGDALGCCATTTRTAGRPGAGWCAGRSRMYRAPARRRGGRAARPAGRRRPHGAAGRWTCSSTSR